MIIKALLLGGVGSHQQFQHDILAAFSFFFNAAGPSGGTFNISPCQDNLITLYRSLFEYKEAQNLSSFLFVLSKKSLGENRFFHYYFEGRVHTKGVSQVVIHHQQVTNICYLPSLSLFSRNLFKCFSRKRVLRTTNKSPSTIPYKSTTYLVRKNGQFEFYSRVSNNRTAFIKRT